jgi:hypothetical protein
VHNKKVYLFTLVMIILILAGCSSTPKAIEGAERDEVLAYAEPMADNVLGALNATDYDAFVKDYDETMLKETTPERFAQLQSIISTKVGKYLSREVTAVTEVGEEAVLVVYSAKFENEEGVTIRIIFQPEGMHLITGLWFDSLKLRE